MKLEVIQKLRETSDTDLAAILIQLLITNEQVYAAFVASQFVPETITFEMINGNAARGIGQTMVTFTMQKSILDELIKLAPSFGQNKVAFIKEVRHRTGASLLEAKLFADNPIHNYTKVGWERM